MRLTLFGMSNSGKSYWSKKLEEKGYVRLSCDDYIEEKLGKELRKFGYSGIADVSKWLGQPYERRYKLNSKKYLELEIESLKTYIHHIKSQIAKKNIVIDTTGSVIYADRVILKELRRYTKIMYLDTPKSVREKMYTSYVENPKPVIWGDIFSQKKGESGKEVLERCYVKLLAFRTKQYKQYAEGILDYFQLRQPNFTVDAFLSLL